MQFQPIRYILGLGFGELQNLTGFGGELLARLGFRCRGPAILPRSQPLPSPRLR